MRILVISLLPGHVVESQMKFIIIILIPRACTMTRCSTSMRHFAFSNRGYMETTKGELSTCYNNAWCKQSRQHRTSCTRMPTMTSKGICCTKFLSHSEVHETKECLEDIKYVIHHHQQHHHRHDLDSICPFRLINQDLCDSSLYRNQFYGIQAKVKLSLCFV
jgi:hypothetical protein